MRLPENGIFYHDPEDAWGCQVEQKARQEILDIAAALLPGSPMRNGFDSIIPIPHTTDLVGVLKGDRNLGPTYKKFQECCADDFLMIMGFRKAYRDLLIQEIDALDRSILENLPPIIKKLKREIYGEE
jgi:hypothetical protein